MYADGYQSHEAQLNDGGIWVTNSRDGFYGRINKPIGQLDGAIFAELDTQLDVVQQGAAVIGVNISSSTLSPINPSTVEHPDGEVAKVPSAAQVQMAGGTVAVLDPGSGKLWAERIDPELGEPLVGDLDAAVAAGGHDRHLGGARGHQGGDVLVASADDDTLARLAPDRRGLREADRPRTSAATSATG